MKKLAIGCGIVALLLAVAGAGVAYYVYRQIGSTVAQFAELAQVPEIERGVSNRSPFTPPPSGDLTGDQVERLVRVQRRIRERLGARVAELEIRYKTLLEKDDPSALDTPQVIAVYRDLAATWLDAKREQVAALNEAGFSLEEYRWVRAQAYSALGLPFMEIDVARLVEDAVSGRPTVDPGELRGSFGPDGSATNRTLVEPFKQPLEDNLALASLGL